MITLSIALCTLSPFRYRGYVYDEETGLYYLRSRYYNPVWGRFVNGYSVLGNPGNCSLIICLRIAQTILL